MVRSAWTFLGVFHYLFFLSISYAFEVVEEAYCCQVANDGSSVLISGRKARPSSGLRWTIEVSRDTSLRAARIRSQNYWGTARALSLCLPVSLPHPLSRSLSLSSPPLSNSHVLFLPLLLLHRFSSFSPFLWLPHSVCFPPPCWRSLFLFSGFIWFKWSLLTLSKSIQCVLTTRLPLIPAVISYISLFDLWKNRIAHSNTSLSNYFCVRLLSHKNLHYMRIN